MKGGTASLSAAKDRLMLHFFHLTTLLFAQFNSHLSHDSCSIDMVYKEKKIKFLFCVFVFLFSVKKTFASAIKYRPGTSDTAENVEINQIIRDK